MTELLADVGLAALLDEWDAAFAAGDADRFAALFTDEASLLLLYREALEGREAIREWLAAASLRLDTSAWEPQTRIVETHGDAAYVFRTYTERLRHRADDSRELVRGRLIYFLRRAADDRWRIALLMNSHSHPMEPLA